MAEFMGDDALQFIPIQFIECALGDHEYGFRGPKTSHESVNGGFLVQYIELGGGNARGDAHFLDHIDQLLFPSGGAVHGDMACAEHLGQPLATLAQLPEF